MKGYERGLEGDLEGKVKDRLPKVEGPESVQAGGAKIA